jgi:hypothetical protein
MKTFGFANLGETRLKWLVQVLLIGPCLLITLSLGLSNERLPFQDGIYVSDASFCSMNPQQRRDASGDALSLYVQEIKDGLLTGEGYETSCQVQNVQQVGGRVIFDEVCSAEGEKFVRTSALTILGPSTFQIRDTEFRSCEAIAGPAWLERPRPRFAPSKASLDQQSLSELQLHYDRFQGYPGVDDLQWALARMGLYVGFFDEQVNEGLIDAIHMFQTSMGLELNYTLTQDDVRHVMSFQRRTSAIHADFDERWRMAVQAQLNLLGYNVGEVDGQIGPITRAAFNRFRVQYGMGESPTADAELYEKLFLVDSIRSGGDFIISDIAGRSAVTVDLAINELNSMDGRLESEQSFSSTAAREAVQTISQNEIVSPQSTANADPLAFMATDAQLDVFSQLPTLDGAPVLFEKNVGNAIGFSNRPRLPLSALEAIADFNWLLTLSAQPSLFDNQSDNSPRVRTFNLLGETPFTRRRESTFTIGGVQVRYELRGDNDFERQEALEQFQTVGRQMIEAASLQPPFRLVEVIPFDVHDYLFEENAFQLAGFGLLGEEPGLSMQARSVSAPYTFDLQKMLPIPRDEAEEFAARKAEASRRGLVLDYQAMGYPIDGDINRHRSMTYRPLFLALTLDIIDIARGPRDAELIMVLRDARVFSDFGLTDEVTWFPTNQLVTNVQTEEEIRLALAARQSLQRQTEAVAEIANRPSTPSDEIALMVVDDTGRLDVVERIIRQNSIDRGISEFDRADFVAETLSTFQALDADPKDVWVPGLIRLGEYDLDRGSFDLIPNNAITFQWSGEPTVQGLGAAVIPRVTNLETIDSLPVDPEIARQLIEQWGISGSRALEARFRLEYFSAQVVGPNQARSHDHFNAEFGIAEVTLLGRLDGVPSIIGRTEMDPLARPQNEQEQLTQELDRRLEDLASRTATDAISSILNLQTVFAHLLSNPDVELDLVARKKLIEIQWHHDRAGLTSRLPRFFEPNDPIPSGEAVAAISDRLIAFYRANRPEKLATLRVVNRFSNDHPLYPRVGSDSQARRAGCDLVESVDPNNIAPIDELMAEANSANYALEGDRTLEPNPLDALSIQTNVIFDLRTGLDACRGERDASRALSAALYGPGENAIARGAVRVVYQIDRLPVPPAPNEAQSNLLELEVTVDAVELIQTSGNPVPVLLVRLGFKKRTDVQLASLGSEQEERTELTTITASDLAALERQLAERSRAAAELDVIGVSLNMSLDEADAILRASMESPVVFEHRPNADQRQQPMNTARLYRSADGLENVVLLHEGNRGASRVLGIVRHVFFGEGGLSPEVALGALVSKYQMPYRVVERSGLTQFYIGENTIRHAEGNTTLCVPIPSGSPTTDWSLIDDRSVSINDYVTQEGPNAWRDLFDRMPFMLPNLLSSVFLENQQMIVNSCGDYVVRVAPNIQR